MRETNEKKDVAKSVEERAWAIVRLTEKETDNIEEEEERTEEEEETTENESEKEEEENIDKRNDHNEHGYERLYFGAPLNISQSMLLILTLAIRHNLNMSCLADIINVINLHCPTHGLKKNSIFLNLKNSFLLKNLI